ncbi:MAG TPA: hypothetical protein VHG51_13635 [Longimicrobiaceae bacterium]|nr:hypothetical protein [Longimicrobiaceae bacterium]
MRTNTWRSAALAGLAVLAAACGRADATPEAARETADAPASAPAPNVVTVGARDFSFQLPRTIPAGLTAFRLVNDGTEMHHAQLVRIGAGHTVDELMALLSRGEHNLPEWATYVGGPNTPVPGGGVTETALRLEAGEYALICVIPSGDGVPHFMKGMVVPVTVEPAAAPAGEPAADVRMVLNDYSFLTTPELKAGRRTIRVENAATQPHEVVLVQLAPGKTAQDLVGWMEKMQGPPPGKPVGGTTAIDRGEVNFVTADLAPGEYALLCMVPDAGDGKPHIAHGMVRQVTVS